MPADLFLEPRRVRIVKFAVIALSMIGACMALFVLAVYASNALQGRMPVANLFASFVVVVPGLVLTTIEWRGRGPASSIVSLVTCTAVGACAALVFGPVGLGYTLIAAWLLHAAVARWRSRHGASLDNS
jgi:hypothetical protein